MKNNRRVKNRGTLLGSHHFEGRGACWNSGMRLGRMTSTYSLIWICTNQTTHWLVHSLSTFGARTSHEQLRTHKTHHALDLGEATTFPLIVFSTTLHGGHIQMAFCLGTPKMGVPKFPQLGFPRLQGPITSHANSNCDEV
jgi:hypothetical protein